MTAYLCAWTSGHTPPRAVYYHELPGGRWGTTFDRAHAKRFRTPDQALLTYLSKHVKPWDYLLRSIAAGRTRAERADQPELLL